MNASLATKPVHELLKHRFYIPKYQRGYRWGELEVTKLLEDIDEFTPIQTPNGGTTWYCLQPLVVKKFSRQIVVPNGIPTQEDWLEVIDGQQRLTTIYLILHILNLRFQEQYREPIFDIDYETRPGSREYLKKISADNTDTSNIDYHHMCEAFLTITMWLKKKCNATAFNVQNFKAKLTHSTSVIWYEVETTEPISIFTRLNMGKIPLNNAELVKALFLNSSNFNSSNFPKANKEFIRLKQLEIATEWDRIENRLHDPRFWFFVHNNEAPTAVRMESILDLIAGKGKSSDSFFTFNFYSERFQDPSKNLRITGTKSSAISRSLKNGTKTISCTTEQAFCWPQKRR